MRIFHKQSVIFHYLGNAYITQAISNLPLSRNYVELYRLSATFSVIDSGGPVVVNLYYGACSTMECMVSGLGEMTFREVIMGSTRACSRA